MDNQQGLDWVEEMDKRYHDAFNKIGAEIAKYASCVNDIYLDIFNDIYGNQHTYIVVQFVGGGISVRNANMNSLIANLQEMTKLLNGGYYEEVEDYNKLKGENNV